jgi:hypothetical protein
MFKIEKNIPIPVPTVGVRRSMYPFADMAVGDSFEVVGKNARQFSGATNSAMKRYGFKFVTRSTESGVRIWRVK